MRLSGRVIMAVWAAIFWVGEGRCQAADAQIAPLNAPIPGLRLLDEPAQLSGEGSSLFAAVRGVYAQTQSGWTLSHENEDLVSTDGKGDGYSFVAHVPLKGPETTFELTAVGPAGELQTQSFKIGLADWRVRSARGGQGAHAVEVLAGALMQQLDLQDARKGSDDETALGVRLDFRMPRPWARVPIGFRADAAFSALPLRSASDSYRSLAGTAAAEYRLPWPATAALDTDPWQARAGLGFHYGTIFSSNERLGFTNAAGPMLVAEISHRMDEPAVVSLSATAGPIFNSGLDLYSLASHRVSAALEYRSRFSSGRAWAASLEYASTNLRLQNVPVGIDALSAGFSIGIF